MQSLSMFSSILFRHRNSKKNLVVERRFTDDEILTLSYPCEIFPAVQARGLAELIEHHVDNSPGLRPLSAHSTRLAEHPGAGQTVHSAHCRGLESNKFH